MAFDNKSNPLVKTGTATGVTPGEGESCRCQALAPDVRELVEQYCPLRQGGGPDCIVDLLLAVTYTQMDDSLPSFDQLH